MHISFDDLQWPAISLGVAVYCFWAGLKAKKFKEKRQAGISMTLMAFCSLAAGVLELIRHATNIEPSTKQNISKTLLIIAGAWLGILIVMVCCGHFKLLKKHVDKLEDSAD